MPRATRLFSYRTESRAARTLNVLRQRHGAEVKFALVPRSDWRLYILATRADGKSGFVAKRPLAQIARAEG
jgi:hypothetical protein